MYNVLIKLLNKDVDGADWDDAWIAKIDSEGNEIWGKTFGGTGDDGAEPIKPTQDGGYIIGGITRYTGDGNFEAWQNKVDSEGNEIWSKTFFTGGTGSHRGDLIQPTTDDSFIFKGTNSYYNSQNAWMIKVDSQGKEVWNRTFKGLGYAPLSILPTEDGGCIEAGTYSGNAWLA